MDLTSKLNGVKAEETRENKNYLPKGKYNVFIDKITAKEGANGWVGLNFQLRVYGPKYDKACLFDSVTLTHNTSKEAVDIGAQRLKKICELAGVSNTDQMLGKKMHVNVDVIPDTYKRNNGEADAMKNVIRGYGEILPVDTTAAKPAVATDSSFTSENIPF